MSPTLGHVEFSTLDNLAEYGWANFATNPTTAQYLMYPLHALGDAAEPHHAAGTTSWGHRPYEDAVDNLLDTELLEAPSSCALLKDGYYLGVIASPKLAQANRIMQAAYGYWQTYGSQFSKGKAPIQQMVQALAISTFATAEANSQVYNDGSSQDYYFNFNGNYQQLSVYAYMDVPSGEYPNAISPDPRPTEQALLEQSVAMTIAFLIGAAETAQPYLGPIPTTDGGPDVPPDGATSTTICLAGQNCTDAGCAQTCEANGDCTSGECSSGCCVPGAGPIP